MNIHLHLLGAVFGKVVITEACRGMTHWVLELGFTHMASPAVDFSMFLSSA